MYSLYELYYTSNQEADEIVEEYDLTRGKIRWSGINPSNLHEGLTKLKIQVIKDLNKLRDDVLGNELFMAEAIRFLLHLLTLQFKPNHDWDTYYCEMLDYFHSQGMLLWKNKLITHKSYKQKRVILTIKDDLVKLPYQSTQAVINDWGRYKADQILNERNAKGNTLTFEQVLEMVLV